MEAVIYARVSTEAQFNNSSLSAQVNECTEYASRKGYIVIETIKEVSSAKTISDREGLQLALKLVKPGRVLVFSRIDRLVRNLEDANYLLDFFHKGDCRFRAVAQKFVGKFDLQSIQEYRKFASAAEVDLIIKSEIAKSTHLEKLRRQQQSEQKEEDDILNDIVYRNKGKKFFTPKHIPKASVNNIKDAQPEIATVNIENDQVRKSTKKRYSFKNIPFGYTKIDGEEILYEHPGEYLTLRFIHILKNKFPCAIREIVTLLNKMEFYPPKPYLRWETKLVVKVLKQPAYYTLANPKEIDIWQLERPHNYLVKEPHILKKKTFGVDIEFLLTQGYYKTYYARNKHLVYANGEFGKDRRFLDPGFRYDNMTKKEQEDVKKMIKGINNKRLTSRFFYCKMEESTDKFNAEDSDDD